MAEYKHGSMDISEHERTFHGFVKMAAWAVFIIVLILGFLAVVAT